jgi:hypothetical protein
VIEALLVDVTCCEAMGTYPVAVWTGVNGRTGWGRCRACKTRPVAIDDVYGASLPDLSIPVRIDP